MANQQDANFVNQLGSGNTAEITEGNLAIQRSPELAVSEFGRWMVTDHTALGSIFAPVAQHAGLSAPTKPDATDQAKIDALSQLSGTKFDQAYVKEQVTDHQQVVALLKQEVSNGQDPGLVSFAKEALPIIQAHLEQAQILSSDLIPGANSTSSGSSTPQSLPSSYSMGAMQQESCAQGTMVMPQDHQASWTS